ncbi:hypothetical protein ACIBEJ_08910 [Nonomuraea sp. NPDC050790]|uniref:hypothetical protein n=1 Tax=Nonomuraea sp. NPDC050790 TaxID=3364371 RepID=UPI00379648DE
MRRHPGVLLRPGLTLVGRLLPRLLSGRLLSMRRVRAGLGVLRVGLAGRLPRGLLRAGLGVLAGWRLVRAVGGRGLLGSEVVRGPGRVLGGLLRGPDLLGTWWWSRWPGVVRA